MAQGVTIIKVFEMANYAVVAWEHPKSIDYVACWLPKVRNATGDWVAPTTINEGATDVKCYWEQGHYFTDKNAALTYAVEKEIEAVEYKIDGLKEYLDYLKWDVDEE